MGFKWTLPGALSPGRLADTAFVGPGASRHSDVRSCSQSSPWPPTPGRAAAFVSLALCPRQSDLALALDLGVPGGPEPLHEAGFGDSTER